MIPKHSITKAFVSLAGEEKLFSMAEDNAVDTMNDIRSIGPSAFIASNGMNMDGSATRGEERRYWWPDSEIDAEYIPEFLAQNEPDLEGLKNSLAARDGFQKFSNYVANVSEGQIDIEPTADIVMTKHRREEKQVLRLGFVATADSAESFEEGVQKLRLAEQPSRKTDYASMILPPEEGCEKLTFRD